MNASKYDYIFLGAGCASLSIVMRMIDSGAFGSRHILLLERRPKTANDRTWCFWEKERNYFDDLVYRKWGRLEVKTAQQTLALKMEGYAYKMIRGIDFYERCFRKMATQSNIDIRYGDLSFNTPGAGPGVLFNGAPLVSRPGALLFNSVYQPGNPAPGSFRMLQHFRGWVLETDTDQFDPDTGILMDFRTGQEQGTTFLYVLPLSSRKALVEYTVFSNAVLPPEQYHAALRTYVGDILSIGSYRVLEEEAGVIPMTNESFPFHRDNLYHIGTAGGRTKPSTGYTFRLIQQQADEIVQQLVGNREVLTAKPAAGRFRFYDSTFLHVLSRGRLEGMKIFTTLFARNEAPSVFRFLDNESTFGEELRLLNTLPKPEFAKAGMREFWKSAASLLKR